MLQRSNFDSSGVKIISRTDGLNRETLMDVTVRQLKKGQHYSVAFPGKETAILLTGGAVTFSWEGRSEQAVRTDVFSAKPWCLHVCAGITARIDAQSDSELIFQSAENPDTSFGSHFYTPDDCTLELMGADKWEGTAKREVLTVFDYNNAPYSKLVIGEVITKAGRWSSYIPHGHPQPEVYYYKFSKPQGFGACFLGEDVEKISDGCASILTGGKTHPQCAAPGYNMYYCWMIRHLDGNPWTTRENDPAHVWLLNED